MRRIAGVILLLVALIVCVALTRHPVRRAASLGLHRVAAAVGLQPDFIFVGDSLTHDGPWRHTITRDPQAILNLAQGGALIWNVADQMEAARAYKGRYLLVAAGTNDIVFARRSPEEIVAEYVRMLNRRPKGPKLIATLIPYTKNPSDTETITAANHAISAVVKQEDGLVIDLNPFIAEGGILRPEMTTDGIHLAPTAYEYWSRQILSATRQ